MPLSAEEIKVAGKAYQQIRDYDACQKNLRMWPFWVCLWAYYFFTMGRQCVSDLKSGYSVITYITILTLFLLILGFRVYRYRRLKSSYAGNLRLLEDLKQKYGAELPSEIKDEHPLLESWSRRLEKRAILWRLDAFLSRKPINH